MPLGNEPIVDKLILTAGADFEHRINVAAGETIPNGTTAKIVILADDGTATVPLATWPATTVTGSYVRWRVESGVADTIPDRSVYRLYIVYDDTPTLDHCWYRGTVTRKQ